MNKSEGILAVGEEPAPLVVEQVGATRQRRSAVRAKQSGRFEPINAFADLALRELPRAEIAVWLLLWRDTKPSGTVQSSQVDLATRAGADVRTVRRAVQSLIDQGLITRIRQGGLRSGANIYRVDVPRKEGIHVRSKRTTQSPALEGIGVR